MVIVNVREIPRDESALRHRLYQHHLHQHHSDRVRSRAPASCTASENIDDTLDSVYINVTFVSIVVIARVRELPRDGQALRHRLYQRRLRQHRCDRMRQGAPT